jgi:hypothetical protein
VHFLFFCSSLPPSLSLSTRRKASIHIVRTSTKYTPSLTTCLCQVTFQEPSHSFPVL